MTRTEASLLHAANALVGGTGIVFAWMRYVLVSDDPYSVVSSPAEPAVQHLHVLTAPVLVFACGLIWQAHVWPRVRSSFRERRRSGISLALGFVPMVVSGYAIQISTDEDWRGVWIFVHLSTSGLWLAAYVAHQWRAWFAGITKRSPTSA